MYLYTRGDVCIRWVTAGKEVFQPDDDQKTSPSGMGITGTGHLPSQVNDHDIY